LAESIAQLEAGNTTVRELNNDEWSKDCIYR
jgi:hypothetical protein